MKKRGKIQGILLLLAAFVFAQGKTVLLGQEHQHDKSREEYLIRKHERDRQRWHWQLPETVLNCIQVKEGMSVGDVGAGDGYFSIRMAKRVGSSGVVYANDIDAQALEELRSKCEKENLKNVRTILGSADDPKLPGRRLDIILLINTFHYLENPVLFFEKIKHSLKPDGIFVVIQWDRVKMLPELHGWPNEDSSKYRKDLVPSTALKAGFELVKEENFLPVQSLHIFCIKQ